MSRALAFCLVAVLSAAAGAFAVQQSYPNQPDTPVIFENDRVVVQKIDFKAGQWSGEHSHGGVQIAVAITDMEQLVKADGKEMTRKLKPGEVLWVDKGTHDHKMLKDGTAVLITLK